MVSVPLLNAIVDIKHCSSPRYTHDQGSANGIGGSTAHEQIFCKNMLSNICNILAYLMDVCTFLAEKMN